MFATPDPDVAFATPTGSRRPSSTCGTRASPTWPPTTRSPWRSNSSGRSGRRPTHPPGVLGRLRRRASRGRPGLDHRHPGIHPADRGVPIRVGHRRRGDRQPHRRPASASRVASPGWTPIGRRRTRSSGPPGCSARSSRRRIASRWCSTRGSSRPCLSVISSALSGEAVVKGRSFFAGRVGEKVATGSFTLVDDPTDPRAFGGRGPRRRGTGLPPERAHRLGRAAGIPLRHGVGTPGRTASTGSAVRGGYAGTPGAGCRALRAPAGPSRPAGRPRRGRRGPLRPVGHRRALRGQPGERRLLGRGRGAR